MSSLYVFPPFLWQNFVRIVTVLVLSTEFAYSKEFIYDAKKIMLFFFYFLKQRRESKLSHLISGEEIANFLINEVKKRM